MLTGMDWLLIENGAFQGRSLNRKAYCLHQSREQSELVENKSQLLNFQQNSKALILRMPIDAVERFRNRWLMHFQLIHHDVHKAKKRLRRNIAVNKRTCSILNNQAV